MKEYRLCNLEEDEVAPYWWPPTSTMSKDTTAKTTMATRATLPPQIVTQGITPPSDSPSPVTDLPTRISRIMTVATDRRETMIHSTTTKPKETTTRASNSSLGRPITGTTAPRPITGTTAPRPITGTTAPRPITRTTAPRKSSSHVPPQLMKPPHGMQNEQTAFSTSTFE
ncbi:hypothetical protein OSTOST_05709 [Ostertagia ostertagi]